MTTVFLKDTGGYTEEQEEKWLEQIEKRYGGLYENLNMYKIDA